MTAGKITVDMRHMTPRLLAAAGTLAGRSIMEMMTGPDMPLAVAAIAAVQHPEYTFDELADTDFADFEMVEEDEDPKVPAANNGGEPQPSPVPGG